MFGFHPVHRRLWDGDKFKHLGYEVYLNNKPFITLNDGLDLKKKEAYTLCDHFNGYAQ